MFLEAKSLEDEDLRLCFWEERAKDSMKEIACSAPWMVEVFRGTQLLGIEKNLPMMSCVLPHINQSFSFLSIYISSGTLLGHSYP